jgi:hypothetical protein
MLSVQVIEILWTKRKYFLSSKYLNQLDGSDLDIGHVELDKEKAKAAEQVIPFRPAPPPSLTPAPLSPTSCDSKLKIHENTFEYPCVYICVYVKYNMAQNTNMHACM